jgi:hypothetical protein
MLRLKKIPRDFVRRGENSSNSENAIPRTPNSNVSISTVCNAISQKISILDSLERMKPQYLLILPFF